MLKIGFIFTLFVNNCVTNIIINSEYSTILPATIEELESKIIVDHVAILTELKNERYEYIMRQLNNVTNNSNSTNNNVISNIGSRIPCACLKGQCGCCSGPLLAALNQKACFNVTYEPDEFAFNAALTINGHVFYNNRISGKNPPPICVRVPRIRIIQVCLRFSNVYFTGPNMHTCVGMEANWDDFQIFNTVFNCFRIGAAGAAIVPPEDGGGIGTNIDEEDEDEDDEDYDDSAR